MAFGFKPTYKTSFYLYGVTEQQFLVLANETALTLGWEITCINEQLLIINTNYEQFTWNAEMTILIGDGSVQISSKSMVNEWFDKGKNKQTVEAFIDKLELIKKETSNEQLELKSTELLSTLSTNENDVIEPTSNIGNAKGLLQLFLPSTGYFVAPILLYLNIVLFALMVYKGANILMPDTKALLNWGANFRPSTLDGDWWRLITSCFVHIGIVHLLMNMYALVYIGLLLEPILGTAKFIAAYVLAGVAASLTSLYWHDLVVSAGASGAIFGLYGVFLALLTTNIIDKSARKPLLASVGVFVLYNLANGLKAGVDNAAHIGGLVSGLAIGFVYIPSIKQPEESLPEVKAIGFLSFVLIGACALAFKTLPNHIATYDFKMKEFAAMESMAMEVYQLPENAPQEEILYGLKDRGIYYWNRNIDLLNSLDKLDLPPELRRRNNLLKEYCQLRLESYQLIYKSIAEETEIYKQQIEILNAQIEEKIKVIEKAM